ncbi:MAG: hypothetical protein JO093_16710 [Acidobacteria bacterium]|nr:hypothetical protein [Acidobacteriota bacterium]MBV9187259.1 hypothetical protein [Acidobacteriota bacterium]
MNVIADKPEAHWLPSRHRFALSRLIAYAKLRRARAIANNAEHLILPIDRDQTAAEMNGVALWVFFTTVCYIAAVLPLILPAAIVAAIPLAAIALQFPIVGIGPIVRMLLGDGDHIKIISVITMALLVIASSYFAVSSSWPRYVAWFFFAVLVVNGAAALVVWLLRNGIREAEDRCAR